MTQWTFKNTGKKMWPKGVQCHQIGYEDITYKFIKVKIESDSCQLVKNCPTPKSLGIDDYQVDLYDEMTIHVEITTPQQPGEVKLRFRLQVVGEQTVMQFGEEVCISLTTRHTLNLQNPFDMGGMGEKSVPLTRFSGAFGGNFVIETSAQKHEESAMDFALAKDTIKEESKEEDLFFVDDDKKEIDAITPDQNLKKEKEAINASLSDKIEIVCAEKEDDQPKQAIGKSLFNVEIVREEKTKEEKKDKLVEETTEEQQAVKLLALGGQDFNQSMLSLRQLKKEHDCSQIQDSQLNGSKWGELVQ